MGIFSFAIKSSIAGGAVFYTIQEGLWSSPEESGKIYNKLYNNISPLLQKNVPPEVLQEIHHLPNPSDLKVCAAIYWNKGVRASVQFISDIPAYVSDGIDKIQKEIERSNLNSAATKSIESK